MSAGKPSRHDDNGDRGDGGGVDLEYALQSW